MEKAQWVVKKRNLNNHVFNIKKDGVDSEVEQMQRFMLKSKIHKATLTGTDLDYEGSITIDQILLEKADILPGEQVHMLNINNGQRFVTYAIAAPRGSGTVLLNGPAARLGKAGDKVIIISYCQVPDEKTEDLKAKVDEEFSRGIFETKEFRRSRFIQA